MFDFPGGADDKASVYNVGDLGLIPGLGRPLEKEMTTHSSILAWRIPWTEEPSGLQSMGSQRVGHDSVTNTFIFIGPWAVAQSFKGPVLLHGKSHGWRSLVGCSPWGREESDMTEGLHFHFPALE